MKILLVEDDKPTAALLAEALTAHRYTIDLATDGQTGLALATAWDFDLILLDVMIPKLDGLGLCRQLRAKGYQKPILLFTSKNSTADVISGFNAGADDYVTKPCEIPELIVRIRALLRRGETALAPALLTWGDLHLNPVSAEVIYQTHTLSLTPKEYSLLELFLRNPQRIFDRGAIIDRIWSIDDLPSEGAVTNLIKNLRQKLRAAGMTTEMLETVYGLGYRLKTPLPKTASGNPPEGEALGRRSQQGLASVNKVLDQFRDSFIERIASLERVEQALRMSLSQSHPSQSHPSQSHLSQALRQTACEDAHKLAGGLGMFGYEEGSRLARAIEHLLMGDRPLTPPEIANLSQRVMDLQKELAHPPKALTTLTKELLLPIQSRSVMVVSRDVTFTESLQAEAVTWGCQLERVPPGSAVQKIAQALPDLILLDCASDQGVAQDSEVSVALLETLANQFPALPMVIIAPESQGDRPTHLDETQPGKRRILQKPISVAQVFEAITQLTDTQFTERTEAAVHPESLDVQVDVQVDVRDAAKVMIVDDDSLMLEALKVLLQPQGFQVTVLEDPGQFWDVLRAIAPDVLLLDLEMPIFSGIDLCQAIRQDSTWKDLPILIVTAHTDIPSLRQVFAAGANDFVSKPIIRSELITRVLNQLDRASAVRSSLIPSCV
ncbi:MAG: response regulator [Drouetiella hepatica Uher 2000/2452]|jgi:DNA-binding response OmpR family regulator/HPt (histidine-containing phosphotransfer) domain-containing protein|uniref:Response regulator n=1 Tax=Drouetiella hepatica Uher 2000/2452 TaxID=904376 RepID=A0A951QBF7_9CYAN|nr:response regulator [Drouetiella hepatica Uher 2000/2452]